MEKLNKQEVTKQTINWLGRVVIGFNFCPFAKRELFRNSIRYFVSQTAQIETCLLELVLELQRLDEKEDIETTLMVYPSLFAEFYDYLDFVGLCQDLLIEQGYIGIYQLATFHPDYCFADAPVHDPANYTNRSPYPTLHLIRESSLEHAIENHPDPESIPDRNIEVAREQGFDAMQKILSDCYKLNE
jgi:hypothetical protein